MKTTKVVVPWEGGLHLRPAADLVNVARKSNSSLTLRLGEKRASLRSIVSLVTLCATMGTPLVLEANGEDEERASQKIVQIFSHPQH
ncbi:HPr family phosphocarrier protein [Ruficoccus amylovorans]|uniref:HPr family phosphocarrier protein n=1 Tax=Ruficoccus amylovorans TaxID=1804625 RepID=A0A842HEA5_9BACT|nr:HPr family phosphocarrier protein [Ruficoccus amylovorans]MBC2594762.1 HPr family phosphocarrier protein [Ruficoccus amylovorans]